MPGAKPTAVNSLEVMMKSEEQNDSLDTFIRQAIGKEPFLNFSRSGDSPVQWIQLLHALDQQDLPGWPLLTPLKVQMQKCDKCSREFCSPINYRRHIRVHHRLKKLDQDSAKNRDLLGAFWDKLSVDEAKEAVSFNNVALEDLPGSSVIKTLTTLVRKPGFSALPQVCLRAGSALLDIIQARSSRFPLSSDELFSILDDASEKTFLSGAAVSMQKYVFDGEAGKIGLEAKNLVACTSFLLEQKLVKAWLADKDAEALRCQKLLVEEEEAARKRQAELLERKRQKKIRQKEQKAREQRDGEKEKVKDSINNPVEVDPLSEPSIPLVASDCDRQNLSSLPDRDTSIKSFQFSKIDEDVDCQFQTAASNEHSDSGTGQDIERQMVQGVGRKHGVFIRCQAPSKSQRGMPNGFHSNQSHPSKFGGMQKHATNRERVAPMSNGSKIWSRKPKPVNDFESLKTREQVEAINQLHQDKNTEVLIGSISVTLGNCSHHEDNNQAETRDGCLAEHQIPKKNNIVEKKSDPVQYGTNRSTVKFWRQVSRPGSKSSMPVQNGGREFETEVISKEGDQDASIESCLRSHDIEYDNCGFIKTSSPLQDNVQAREQFDSNAAKAFLAERWKEAVTNEHVKLVLYPDIESSGHSETKTETSDSKMCSVLGNAENRLEVSTGRTAQFKFRTKPERGGKIKYIPKQRTVS